MEKRFSIGWNDVSMLVIDIPTEKYNKLAVDDKIKHQVVRIALGGIMSRALAETYAQQIADQLNGFDVANATVAKLT